MSDSSNAIHIEVLLRQGKETKGTYRYDADDPNAPIMSLYIRKSAFRENVPPAIRLLVEPAP